MSFKRALSSNLSFTGIFVLLTFVICSHVLKGTYLRQVFTQKRLWNITALFHAFRCRSEAPGIMASPPAQRWAGSVQETGGAPGIIWRPGWGWFQGAQGRVVQGGVYEAGQLSKERGMCTSRRRQSGKEQVG